MSRCLDQKVNGRYPFQYTPKAATDIRKTFARERKRLAEEAEKIKVADAEMQIKVKPIKKGAQG